MKRSDSFLLRDVAGTLVIVPLGAAAAKFPEMITLNATAAYLWELLEQEQSVESLAAALQDRYEVDKETATADVVAFIERLKPVGAIV